MGIKKIAKDLLEQRFGKLVVVERAPSQNGHAMWKCVCDCNKDKTITVRGSRLISGHTTTCGCHRGAKLPSIETVRTNNTLNHIITNKELYDDKINAERNEIYEYLISLASELKIKKGICNWGTLKI